VAVMIALLMIMRLTPSHAGPVHVEGATDCGLWAKARGEHRAGYLESYLIGLLSGLSLGREVEFWQAYGHPLSRDAVYLWMDKYCNENPLKDIVEGMSELFLERSGWRPAQ